MTLPSYREGLTRIESAILDVLEAHEGRVVSRDAILEHLGDLSSGGLRSVDIRIMGIRRKLGREAIVAAHGFGYRLGNVHKCAACNGSGVVTG